MILIRESSCASLRVLTLPFTSPWRSLLHAKLERDPEILKSFVMAGARFR